MTSSPRSRLHTSLAIGTVLLALGVLDFFLSDRHVRPWVLVGFGAVTAGGALVRLRRGSDLSEPDPTLRQGFWMFAGFFLFGVVTIIVATTEDGLGLVLCLVAGILAAAYGAIGLVAVALTYRAERRGSRPDPG